MAYVKPILKASKVASNQFNYYTDVLFTQYAVEYNWLVKFEDQIRQLILFMVRRVPKRKRIYAALGICQQIVAQPEYFEVIVFDAIFAYL